STTTSTTTASTPSTTAPARPLPGADHYAFLAHDGTRPMRYDPCTPVHYVINPALAPVNGVDDLQEAVRRVSSITGITLVFDGFTDEIPESRRGLDPNLRYPHGWPP